MSTDPIARIAALPKAELHLHLEGSVEPASAVELAARHGLALSHEEAEARYRYADFRGFLDAFKWVTSLLREPADFALITERLLANLRRQNVVYAEVTLSAGVMLLRRQDVAANFAAVREAAAQAAGPRVAWIFDGVRQFGPGDAREAARWAARLKTEGVVAFGLGGDERAIPAAEFRGVYDFLRSEGLHAVAHAGEIGSAQDVRDAVEQLGAERIGHGIAAANDPAVMELLAARGTALEICPTSNLRTGALALQRGTREARIEEHPVREFVERGLRVTLSTDDPPMFATDLAAEYAQAARAGLDLAQLVRVARAGWEAAFLPEAEKAALLAAFDAEAARLGL